VPGVNEVGSVGFKPEDLLEPYLSDYSVDYGSNPAVEVSEANVTFITIREVAKNNPITRLVMDPPYSLVVSEFDRSNLGLFREIVGTTNRLQRLLNSAGISCNFTRLVGVIDARAHDLNIGPRDPRVSYFREINDLIFGGPDAR
jgi:hypothetical protein